MNEVQRLRTRLLALERTFTAMEDLTHQARKGGMHVEADAYSVCAILIGTAINQLKKNINRETDGSIVRVELPGARK